MKKYVLFLFIVLYPFIISAQPSTTSIIAVSDDTNVVYTTHIGFGGNGVDVIQDGYKAAVKVSADVTAVGDCTSGECFNGTKGTTLHFLNANTPSAPPANHLLLYNQVTQGHSRPTVMDDDGIEFVINRDNVLIVRNTSGSDMTKGQVVYQSGSTGNVPNVALAKADSLTTLPAIGLLVDNIANNAFGNCMVLGVLSSVDTSAFSSADRLYVSKDTAGALTATRPSNPNFAQRIGSVQVSGVGNGSIRIATAPFIGGEESGTVSNTFTFGNGTFTTLTFDAGSTDPTFTFGSNSIAFNAPLSVNASDPADTEAIRLDNSEGIAWESSPAGTDYTVSVDTSEVLQASGAATFAGLLTASAGLTSSAGTTTLGTLAGTIDAGGATSFEVPNGANPTVDAAGEVATDSSATTGAAFRFYADASYTLPGYQVKSFAIDTPTASSDYEVGCFPANITIKNIRVLSVGGTNVVGGLQECDANGLNCSAIDADITASAGTTATDDGSLTNPTVDAGDQLQWLTTSISGTPTRVVVTYYYVYDAVN